MSARLRVFPGLLTGLVPVVLLPVCAVLLVLELGGLNGLSRAMGMAGPAIHRVIALTVACTLGLAIVHFFIGAGRKVPLLVPLVLAVVPWLLGIRVALKGASLGLEAAAQLNPEEQLRIILASTGELLCARLIGAWFSAALLLSIAAGFFLAGLWPHGPSQEPGASEERHRMFEALVPLLLALTGLLSALESAGLSEALLAASQSATDGNLPLLQAAAQQLQVPWTLRYAAMGALLLVLVALGARRLMQRPRSPRALASLVAIILVVAGVLWADGRPLARMEEAAKQSGQSLEGLNGGRLRTGEAGARG